MENVVFVLRFRICIRGVGEELGVGFLRFLFLRFFEKFVNSLFEGLTLNKFKGFYFRVKDFEFKIVSSKSRKAKNSQQNN